MKDVFYIIGFLAIVIGLLVACTSRRRWPNHCRWAPGEFLTGLLFIGFGVVIKHLGTIAGYCETLKAKSTTTQ